MNKKMNDETFKNITTRIFNVFFSHEKNKSAVINKINIFINGNDLINIKYLNLGHLLGTHYYEEILNLTRRSDIFFAFLYNSKISKIIWSSIVKKVNSNWKFLRRSSTFERFRNHKDLLRCLESKLFCFDKFIDKFIDDDLTNKNMIIYDSNNSNIKNFIVFHVEENKLYVIGLKNITEHDYFYSTFVPMSMQIKLYDILKNKNKSIIKIKKVIIE